MRKVVTIDGKQIPLQSDGGTMRKYRRFFNRDFLSDLVKLDVMVKTGKSNDAEMATVMENITWVLAKRANPSIPEIDEWLENFDDPMALMKSAKEIFSVLSESQKPTIKPKKTAKKYPDHS